jgi:hypothetical protein
MRPRLPDGVVSALGWFVLPLIPALLGAAYHQGMNLNFGSSSGPDPREWGWFNWVVLTGPLIGYGFLAGATIDLPDDPTRRGLRSWLATRSLWVTLGPWVGFLVTWLAILAIGLFRLAYPPSQEWSLPWLPAGWWNNQWAAMLFLAFWIFPLANGWLFVAWAALRRAKRLDRLGRSLAKGLAMAIGFVGSLFGSFWAITEAWRGHFFDPRIAPVLVAALSLAMLTGCAKTETLGDIRRRELFQAMLTAWLLGLALVWRWWSRSKPKPPGSSV